VRGQQHHADGRDGSANQARALQAITQPPCGKADREEPQAVLIVGRAPPGGSAGPRSRESLAGPDAAVEAVLRWSQRAAWLHSISVIVRRRVAHRAGASLAAIGCARLMSM